MGIKVKASALNLGDLPNGKTEELQVAGGPVGQASAGGAARGGRDGGERRQPPLCCRRARVFGCSPRGQHCLEPEGYGGQ